MWVVGIFRAYLQCSLAYTKENQSNRLTTKSVAEYVTHQYVTECMKFYAFYKTDCGTIICRHCHEW